MRSPVRGLPLLLCTPVLALLAAAVIAVGLADRAVDGGRASAALHVAPWSASAYTARSLDLLGERRWDEAQDAARAAVARSPLSAPAVAALALAMEGAGDAQRGFALVNAGAGLGWRAAPIQHQLALAALQAGDYPGAAAHLDALARSETDAKGAFRLLDVLLRDPRLAPALAERLRSAPAWRQGYFTQIDGIAPDALQSRLRLLHAVGRTDSPPRRDELYALVQALLLGGDPASARALWAAQAALPAKLAPGGLYDGQFAAPVDLVRFPFEWGLSGGAGATAAFDDGSPRPGLQVDTAGTTETLLAIQMLLLPPGAHQLTVGELSNVDPVSRSLVWKVDCYRGRGRIPQSERLVGVDEQRRRLLAFVVPPRDCTVQALQLWAKVREPARPASARFYDAQLR